MPNHRSRNHAQTFSHQLMPWPALRRLAIGHTREGAPEYLIAEVGAAIGAVPDDEAERELLRSAGERTVYIISLRRTPRAAERLHALVPGLSGGTVRLERIDDEPEPASGQPAPPEWISRLVLRGSGVHISPGGLDHPPPPFQEVGPGETSGQETPAERFEPAAPAQPAYRSMEDRRRRRGLEAVWWFRRATSRWRPGRPSRGR